MKKVTLILLCIFSFSCNKDIELDGTIWKNKYGSEQFEFYDNNCKFTKKIDISKEITGFYQYEYDAGKITLIIPPVSGLSNYTGEVSKSKMTLYPILNVNGKDTIIRADGFVRVYYLK